MVKNERKIKIILLLATDNTPVQNISTLKSLVGNGVGGFCAEKMKIT
ncbi:hypothetical protein FM106_05770 [Brachybacterium faecium]|nr:hypothetical protein FM106_05770 [Brachybacterium faecium]